MTTNKPEVVAYRYTASQSFGKRNPKWHYQESFPHAENRKVEEIGRLEKLIRLSDYESLQAETEKMAADWSRAMAEYEKLLHNLAPFVSNLSPTSEDFDKARATLVAHRKQGDQP